MLNWGVDAITAVFPFPVPAWGMGIYQNGILNESTTSGSTSISPDDLVTHASSVSIFTILAGDTIELKNIAIVPLNLVSAPMGLIAPIASARLNIVLESPL